MVLAVAGVLVATVDGEELEVVWLELRGGCCCWCVCVWDCVGIDWWQRCLGWVAGAAVVAGGSWSGWRCCVKRRVGAGECCDVGVVDGCCRCCCCWCCDVWWLRRVYG